MKKTSIVLFIAVLIMACGSSKSINSPSPSQTSEDEVLIQKEGSEKVEVVEKIEVVEEPIEIADTATKSIDSTETIDEPIFAQAFNHEAFDALLKANVSETGIVNYKGFIQNKKLLEDYISSLGESSPSDTWTKEDKLAYWMNAYNAMTINLIIRNYPLKSIKDLDKPWDQRLWKLGDKWYNLNEIEHQILRKMDEPRIHFGINCASFSCPPLLNEAFNASKVDSQLNILAFRFINDPKRNSISEMSVEISEIFSWFAKDFKKDGSLFEFLNKYSAVQIDSKAKKEFKKYDWTLNE
jgi:hypothetical protein